MPERTYAIAYPRRVLARALCRFLGRLILPLFFSIQVTGRDHFPASGPLLVVGNHAAVMEAVLMVVYTPWQVEILGAADIPHEAITRIAMGLYGMIPVHRGRFDRAALTQSLDVLKQGGRLAIFPEGGVWNEGAMQAQTGVAWLSDRAHAPVLPVGFAGMQGALGAGLKLKRPRLTMNVGRPIAAASPPPGKPRKAYLQAFANRVLNSIRALLPAEERASEPCVFDERFELEIATRTPDGAPVALPAEPSAPHRQALAKLLHNPAVLKIFTSNLRLPTACLQDLKGKPDAQAIAVALQSILDYLDEENPYLLTYRFGPREAEAMYAGLQELLALARWAAASNLELSITPIRRYHTSPDRSQEVVQIEQGTFDDWM